MKTTATIVLPLALAAILPSISAIAQTVDDETEDEEEVRVFTEEEKERELAKLKQFANEADVAFKTLESTHAAVLAAWSNISTSLVSAAGLDYALKGLSERGYELALDFSALAADPDAVSGLKTRFDEFSGRWTTAEESALAAFGPGGWAAAYQRLEIGQRDFERAAEKFTKSFHDAEFRFYSIVLDGARHIFATVENQKSSMESMSKEIGKIRESSMSAREKLLDLQRNVDGRLDALKLSIKPMAVALGLPEATATRFQISRELEKRLAGAAVAD